MRAYRERHDLEGAPEAPGVVPEPADRPIFVVQQHAASSMHYDLRLEADGVLKSWAVPKGPSTDPSEKRLAVRVEDHSLGYADFEGVIGEGEYGGGSVIVWDIGPYRNLTTDDDGAEVDVATAVDAGHVKVWLAGDKLRGGWALTHAKVGGDEANWLLVKVADETADARCDPTSTETTSVLSGRTVAEVTEDPGR
nr:DNA polymerase ligase N-terminal domain-containing protein [Salsipaludibacter albus]